MKLNKKTIAATATALVLVGGSAAFAWVNASAAAGSGTATTDPEAPELTIVAGPAQVVNPMQDEDLIELYAANASDASLVLVAGTLTSANTTLTVAPVACQGSFAINVSGTDYTNAVVPAGTTSAAPVKVASVPVSFLDSLTESQEACLGAVLTVTVVNP